MALIGWKRSFNDLLEVHESQILGLLSTDDVFEAVPFMTTGDRELNKSLNDKSKTGSPVRLMKCGLRGDVVSTFILQKICPISSPKGLNSSHLYHLSKINFSFYPFS